MTTNPTESDISQMMARAKKDIEEKKAALGLTMTIKDELAAKRAKLAASLASTQVQNILNNPNNRQHVKKQHVVTVPVQTPEQRQQTAQDRERSLNLIIDSEGRTVDKRTGELVQIESRTPTLKANLKVQQKKDIKPTMLNDKKTDLFASGYASIMTNSGITTMANSSSVMQGLKSNIAAAAGAFANAASATSSAATDQSEKFFDARLKLKTAERNKRKLMFNDKGKYEEMANKMRTKTKLAILKQEIASISRRTGISSESKLALIQPKKFTKETIPNIEWWDFALLENEINYDCLEKLNEAELRDKLKINKLIEHPVQMKPPIHNDKKIIPAVMLTAKERKKLRRQNRFEALKEEQEKIRLGLMPPPEPKVKISNLMRVLGSEAVQDPTKVEEYVRNQMAKRQKAHEDHNASRKLTDAERAAKKKRKIMENTSTGIQVSVYRIRELNDPSVKFKLEANCNQLHMTGIVMLFKNMNLVVVEGGPKQQRKFKQLMIKRIKWSELINKKSEENEDGEKEKNTCKLVWEGSIKNRIFGPIIFKSCPTLTFAHDYFKKLGCEHYFDIAQSDAILESSDL